MLICCLQTAKKCLKKHDFFFLLCFKSYAQLGKTDFFYDDKLSQFSWKKKLKVRVYLLFHNVFFPSHSCKYLSIRPPLTLNKWIHSFIDTSSLNYLILLFQHGLMWPSAAFKLMENEGRGKDAPSAYARSRKIISKRCLLSPQGFCPAPSVLPL